MQLVFSQVGRPRGRGKIERFLETRGATAVGTTAWVCAQGGLAQVSGASRREGASRDADALGVGATFREWLLLDSHHRVQKGQNKGPQERRARGRIFAENARVVGAVGLGVGAGGKEAAGASRAGLPLKAMPIWTRRSGPM